MIQENPARLFIGDQHTVHNYTINYLQQKLCAHNACNNCNTCHMIRNKQHHALLWLTPEKLYTREELEPLFHTISFALDNDQLFFIVLEKADYLTASCANSLLKSLEEPPQGYQFLLLTDRPDQLLPTIRSRLTNVTVQTEQKTNTLDPLFHLFTTTNTADPSLFLKLLDKEKLTEQKTIALLDQLLVHWISVYKKNISSPDNPTKHNVHQDAQRVITLLNRAIKNPPMPGGSKIMWKNLFLQIKK
jgi:DNA polymerase III delta prime subunit